MDYFRGLVTEQKENFADMIDKANNDREIEEIMDKADKSISTLRAQALEAVQQQRQLMENNARLTNAKNSALDSLRNM